MKLMRLLLAVVIFSLICTGCKSNDVKIEARVIKALRADDTIVDPTVEVDDGNVTISGQCTDQPCRQICETTVRSVKGVRSVINKCTIPEPVPPPVADTVSTVLDEETRRQVIDGLKDIPGAKVEFSGDKAVVSGTVTPANRKKIMQVLASAKVFSDVRNLKSKNVK